MCVLKGTLMATLKVTPHGRRYSHSQALYSVRALVRRHPCLNRVRLGFLSWPLELANSCLRCLCTVPEAPVSCVRFAHIRLIVQPSRQRCCKRARAQDKDEDYDPKPDFWESEVVGTALQVCSANDEVFAQSPAHACKPVACRLHMWQYAWLPR